MDLTPDIDDPAPTAAPLLEERFDAIVDESVALGPRLVSLPDRRSPKLATEM